MFGWTTVIHFINELIAQHGPIAVFGVAILGIVGIAYWITK